jgi:hypothetical protein
MPQGWLYFVTEPPPDCRYITLLVQPTSKGAPMTAAAAIEQLRQLDPDAVLCAGNKDGYLDAVTRFDPANIRQMKYYPDYKQADKIGNGDSPFYKESVNGMTAHKPR